MANVFDNWMNEAKSKLKKNDFVKMTDEENRDRFLTIHGPSVEYDGTQYYDSPSKNWVLTELEYNNLKMDVKIKINYNSSEPIYSLQNPDVNDGDRNNVVTATIRNAPSADAAIQACMHTSIVRLRSCDYSELGLGKIINR